MDFFNWIFSWGAIEAQVVFFSCLVSIPFALLLPFFAYTSDGKLLNKPALRCSVLPLVALILANFFGVIANADTNLVPETIALNVLSIIFIFGIGAALRSTFHFRKHLPFGIIFGLIQILWVCAHCGFANMMIRGSWF